ncbi:MAG: sigma-70 family RNA polymerase sigma factor [Huintestinicola sp.]
MSLQTGEQNRNEIPAEELFESYSRSHTSSLRNTIVMRYMHIVRYAVISTRNMYSKFADKEDVTNEAVIALMNAVDSFDPEKNAKFETFASIRVRGAIIDYIRRMDFIPRGVRRFAKEYDAAYSELYASLGREPAQDEIAQKLGITTDKLESNCARSAAAQTLSFEELVFGGFDISDDEGAYEAEKKLVAEERRACLAEAISSLKDKERTVITLYYYEKLKYSEIAEVLGLSESRVCQIHAKAVEKLRDHMSEYMEN